MSEETQNTPSEQNKEVQTQETEAKQENKSEDLKNRLSNVETKLYAEREAKLKEMENRLDQKMKNFENLIEESEKLGITTTGEPRKSEEDLVKEKVEAELNSFEA